MAHDREVAGIRCFEVLALLSAYLDDELESEQRQTVDAHLAGCDWCESFGGQVGDTIVELRASLGTAPAAPKGVDARLAERLEHELGTTPPDGEDGPEA